MADQSTTILIGAGGIAAGCLLGMYLNQDYNSFKEFYKSLQSEDSDNSVAKREYPLKLSGYSSSAEDLRNRDAQLKQRTDLSSASDKDTPTEIYADFDRTTKSTRYSPLEAFPDVSKNRTLMARYLTPELYEHFANCRTSFGTDIDACIQAGLDNPGKVSCGITACDEECYDVFANLFDPIITDRHRGFTRDNVGLTKRLEHTRGSAKLTATPFDPKYVKSIHFLVGRCLRGFRFPPRCGRAERNHTERLLKTSLLSLQDEFSGTYRHLTQLTEAELSKIPDILQSVAECPTSATLRASGSTRDWPSGRGIFHSHNGKLFAWTNREDHLRVMYRAREDGSPLDFIGTYQTFRTAMNQVEQHLRDNGVDFAYHESYGYLLTCPSGIGTALRAGAHIKLPRLVKDVRFRGILKNLRLHMGAEDANMLQKGYVDVYNMDRLGFQEEDLVAHVCNSIAVLVEMEKSLEDEKDIGELVASNEMLYHQYTSETTQYIEHL